MYLIYYYNQLNNKFIDVTLLCFMLLPTYYYLRTYFKLLGFRYIKFTFLILFYLSLTGLCEKYTI